VTRWQRRARLIIVLFAVAFAVVLARQWKPRPPPAASTPVPRSDPGAAIEVAGGRLERFKSSRQDVSVEFKTQQIYANGSMKLYGVTITAEEKDGKGTLKASGKEAEVGADGSAIVLNGDVQLVSSEVRAHTEHATFDPATDIAGPLPLAVAVETSKPRGVDVDIGVTRMVVIGTSRFVDNSSLGGGNLDLFMNAVNWLLQREQLMAVSPKMPDEFRLDMSPSQQHAVYTLVIGGLPLLVAIIGIVVWVSRRK